MARPNYYTVTLVNTDNKAYEGSGPTIPAARAKALTLAVREYVEAGLPPPTPGDFTEFNRHMTSGPHPRF